MAENEYKISLGVDIDVSDIQSQINTKTKDKTIPIKVEIENLKDIKNQIQNLSKSDKPSLDINTVSLEKSLDRVATAIEDIKKSLSTVDGKSGMQSLLSSINQITTALGKAESETDSLVKSLSSLSKKDFSFNFNLKSGNSNPVKAMTDYGREARNRTIPVLQEQAAYLQDLLGGYDKADRALQNYLVKIYKLNGANVKSNLLDDMADTSSLSKQMDALERYVGYLKKIATLNNKDLSGFDATFSKSADKLVDDTVKIQTGAKQAEEELDKVTDKLKQVFGSGIDVEGLSTALDPILQDLKAIRESIEGLSKSISIDGLTQSFDRLSESIELLVKNCTTAKQAINDTVGGLSGSVGGTDSGVKNINNDLKQMASSAEKAENKVDELDNAIDGIDVNSKITSMAQDMEELGASVQKVSKTLNGDGSFSVQVTGIKELNDGLKQSITLIQKFNSEGELIGDTQKFTDNIQKANNELLKLKNTSDGLSNSASMAKMSKQYSDVEISLKKLSDVTSNIELSFSNLTGVYKELTSAQQNYKNVMSQSDATDEQKIDAMNRLVNANKEYQNALVTTNNLIKQQANLEKANADNQKLQDDRDIFKSKIDAWLTNNSAATKRFGAQLRQLRKDAETVDRVQLNHLNKELQKVDRAADKAGLKMMSLGDRISTKFKEYSAYFSVAEVFMYTEQALRSMFEQVKLIDSAMTELKKVTDETDASYERFLTNAASKAKEIGTTIDGLVSSTADFARLGYDFADAQGLAEVANIYAVVGDDIDNVEQATQSLISTLTAFKDEMNGMSDSDFAMSIVDKMNEVANNYAISSGGIGDALQRSASSMMAANNSLDETIALITAANTVVVLCHAA